jgi:hypothetical protein
MKHSTILIAVFIALLLYAECLLKGRKQTYAYPSKRGNGRPFGRT